MTADRMIQVPEGQSERVRTRLRFRKVIPAWVGIATSDGDGYIGERVSFLVDGEPA